MDHVYVLRLEDLLSIYLPLHYLIMVEVLLEIFKVYNQK